MAYNPASGIYDIAVQVADLSYYWFLGAGVVTVTGYCVDRFNKRTGNSFSVSVNAGNGSNLPVWAGSLLSGGFPVDSQGSIGPTLSVTGATTATPPVLTATSHGLVNGQGVQVKGVGVVPDGQYYAKNVSANTFSLYSDTTLQTAVVGAGSYSAGATAFGMPNPTTAAVGMILRFSGTTYWDLQVSPSADFIANYANYSQYGPGDGNVPIGRVNTG